MTFLGQVREWHDEHGWGVIDSAETPGGCWAHFSMLLMPGYRTLAVGAAVEFTFEPADQDGFAFRANELWPAGQTPERTDASRPTPSTAYSSTLTITADDPEPPR